MNQTEVSPTQFLQGGTEIFGFMRSQDEIACMLTCWRLCLAGSVRLVLLAAVCVKPCAKNLYNL